MSLNDDDGFPAWEDTKSDKVFFWLIFIIGFVFIFSFPILFSEDKNTHNFNSIKDDVTRETCSQCKGSGFAKVEIQ